MGGTHYLEDVPYCGRTISSTYYCEDGSMKYPSEIVDEIVVQIIEPLTS